ncbi:SDR family oxidoreductase [Streptomonospora litoralis]|uniref:SDR family oxidoreductase n=1 Tax=Streptomonospora litoralis TaxID=2498135 RepID=UPI0013F14E5F|nr:SDR family oxidoreductase [Streptomonospora litoralis]
MITGATSGFGAALAHALAAQGANVVIAGRTAEQAASIAGTIGVERALGVGCDVRRPEDLDSLWEAAAGRFGRIDHWVNNAGIGHPHERLDGLDATRIAAVLATNLTGALLGSQRALRGMHQQGGGCIWLTEGLGSNGPLLAGTGVYSASKAGATRAHRVLAKECRRTGIRVGFLRPGIMPTRVALGEPGRPVPPTARTVERLLGERPERIARHFAPKILTTTRNGRRLTWLTPTRIVRRLAAALRRTSDTR